MTAEQLFLLMLEIINKHGGGGGLSASEFNLIINTAQNGFVDEMVKVLSEVKDGGNLSKGSMYEKLSPIIVTETLSTSGGVAAIPTNFLRKLSMLTDGGDVIRFCAPNKYHSFAYSVIEPKEEYPFYRVSDSTFIFEPSDVEPILTYIKTPPAIVYAVILDLNGREEYDEVNSVNPVWDAMDVMEIVARAAAIKGINLDAQNVYAFANDIKHNGQ